MQRLSWSFCPLWELWQREKLAEAAVWKWKSLKHWWLLSILLNSAFSARCTPLNLLWPQKQRGLENYMEDDEDKCINIVVRYLSMSEAMKQQCLCERTLGKHNFLQHQDIHLNAIYTGWLSVMGINRYKLLRSLETAVRGEDEELPRKYQKNTNQDRVRKVDVRSFRGRQPGGMDSMSCSGVLINPYEKHSGSSCLWCLQHYLEPKWMTVTYLDGPDKHTVNLKPFQDNLIIMKVGYFQSITWAVQLGYFTG